MTAKSDGSRNGGAGVPADETGVTLRKRPFPLIRVSLYERFGDDQAKHPIAKKFQPLISGIPAACGAGMAQSRGQQGWVLELMPERVLKRRRRLRRLTG